MIDDDPDAVRPQVDPTAEASSAAEDDPLATRAPDGFDAFATRADESPSTWLDPGGGPSSPGRIRPGVPRFRILRAHARGALGEVYLAHDEELRREVALKEIQDRHADDPRSRARFLLEAEVTGSLEHPGIVPVYGLGHHPDGRPYYAMRFIRGGSLKEAVDRHHRADGPRPDPAERALSFRTLLGKFVDICNAMAYAHSRDVLHRDLKPGNVMLGPYGETLIVDWGLAKSLAHPGDDDPREAALGPLSGESSATVAGSIIGTPAFMSPEQAAGDLDRLGPASDIYSLGATLYYLLTGRPAFDGPDVGDTLARVRKGDFPPPRTIRRDIPRALQAIALKAMAPRPEDRYPTARALAADVEHWLAGASVSAYPDWLALRLWRWCRRHPVLSTAALSCLFLDVCCVVLSLLAYVERVLHAGSMPRLNMAAGVLVLIPFAGQVGALIGPALGAVVGGAWRRSWAGLRRGAGVGLKVGVPTAIVAYLAFGTFGIARPPSWVPVASTAPAPVPALAWPKLPGAWVERPRWIKPGAPVDIAAFLDEPPREENAAPAYLDALIEFDDGMASCFSPDEGARRASVARRRKQRFRDLDRAWRADPATVDRAALDSLLEEFEVGFLKLRLAQRRPRCVFRTGLGLEALLPHAEAAREVARATALHARRRIELGEVERAIDDLAILLRLARDLRPRGTLISQLVSIAVENVAENEILQPILREPGLHVEQADRLLKLLEAHSSELLDPFVEGFRAEYVVIGQTVHQSVERLAREETLGGSRARNLLRPFLASAPGLPTDTDFNLKATLVRMEKDIDDQLSKATPRGFAESSGRAYDEFHRAMLGLGGHPILERIKLAERLPKKLLGDQPFLLLLTPASGDFLRAVGRSESARGAMKCLIALRRWELEGRGEPTDLEAVVGAAGMAKVPPDPFRLDGGPLRMLVDRGEPVVYSIGLDGLDDGGSLDAKQGVEPRGDYLYRLKPAVAGR